MTNFKALIEKRTEHQSLMDELISLAEKENRALSDDEMSKFDEAESKIKSIDATLDREERARSIGDHTSKSTTEDRADESWFANYVLGKTSELRAGEQNITMSNNGAILPTTIANRIIKEVRDRCPIFSRATLYRVKGLLKVPVWGLANNTHNIAVGYQTEFSEITADAGKFTTVDLGGYLAGALTLIGQSVENNSSFSVTNFIVSQMAEEIATWLEGELLNGTGTSAAQGALNTSTSITAASTTALTADELISLQACVKQAYQTNACWTMHPDTFVSIRKLKDSNGRYLLQDDISNEFPYKLLGKPVYLSDNMPKLAAGKKTVLYGDYSGLSVNIREDISIQVLREKYATQHAIGVVSWMEFDSKVTNNQKLSTITMKASA